MPYVEGRLQGIASDTDLLTGIRVGETSFWQGMRHGHEREFYPDGTLREESLFEYDVRVRRTVWSPDGDLLYESHLDPTGPEWRFLQQQRDRFGQGSSPGAPGRGTPGGQSDADD